VVGHAERTRSSYGKSTLICRRSNGALAAAVTLRVAGDRRARAPAELRPSAWKDHRVLVLPEPKDLSSLVLRTDFSDDAAWQELQTTLGDEDATYVSDPRFAGVPVQTLVDADAAAEEDVKLTYLFLADATTITDEEHPLLAVDLYEEPGRVFRLPPRWYSEVSANLCIANMDFQDFADATDASGTFRGFERN
jgi:hypothetical protein